MRILLSLVLVSLLAGCAQQGPVKLYSGAERPASQVLVVQVPVDLEILDINGEEVAELKSLVRGDEQTLHLQPGQYRINAFYRRIFDIGGMTHEVVRSRSAYFTIDGQAGDVWRLAYKQPDNLEQARELSRNFDAWSQNLATGERLQASTGQVPATLVSQLLGGAESTAAPRAEGVAPLNQPTSQPAAPAPMPVAAAAAPQPQARLPHNDATLATLQQLWQLLTPESQKAFMDWAGR